MATKAGKGRGGGSAQRAAPPPPTMTTDLARRATTSLPPVRKPLPSTMRFANAMAEVRELVRTGKIKRDAWVPIATFTAKAGARTVLNAMDRGERPVDGERADWQIEARREGDGSVLWVRLAPVRRRGSK